MGLSVLSHILLFRVLPHSVWIVSIHPFIQTQCSLSELELWKRSLPFFIEMGRENHWKHTKKCEYNKSRSIPLSIKEGEKCFCSCGAGEALPPFFSNSPFSSVKKYFTRFLLPLPFPPHTPFDINEEKSALPSSSLFSLSSLMSSASLSSSPSSSSCDNCGALSCSLKACSVCKSVWYCNKQCQKTHWKLHKSKCNKK